MDTKTYLSQIKEYENVIKNNLSEIYHLRMLASSIKATNDGISRSKGQNNDPMGNAVARIVDLENETEIKVKKFIEIRKKIIRQIEYFKNTKYYAVLFERYVDCKTFETIANENDYSFRQIVRIHKIALQEFEKVFGDEYMS